MYCFPVRKLWIQRYWTISTSQTWQHLLLIYFQASDNQWSEQMPITFPSINKLIIRPIVSARLWMFPNKRGSENVGQRRGGLIKITCGCYGAAEEGGRRGRRDKQEHTGCGFGDSGPAGLQAWSQSTKEEGKQREGGGGQNPPNHIKGGGRAPFLLLQRSSGEPTSNGSAVPGGERFVFKLLLMWKSFVSLCFFTLCSVSTFCAFILKSSYKRKKCQTRQNPPISVFLCPDVRNSCAQRCRVFRCPFVPFLRYLNMAKKITWTRRWRVRFSWSKVTVSSQYSRIQTLPDKLSHIVFGAKRKT